MFWWLCVCVCVGGGGGEREEERGGGGVCVGGGGRGGGGGGGGGGGLWGEKSDCGGLSFPERVRWEEGWHGSVDGLTPGGMQTHSGPNESMFLK